MPELSPTRFTMVPARRSNEPAARRRARRILGALFLAATLSIVAVVIALAGGRGKPDLSNVNPQARDLAYTSAVTYLAGGTLNVPHVDTFDPAKAANTAVTAQGGRRGVPLPYQSVNWVGFTPQIFGSKKVGITNFEVHHFLVTLAPAQAQQNPPKAAPSRTSPPRADGEPSPSGSARPSETGRPATTASPTTQAPASPSASPSPSSPGGAPPGPNVLQLDVSILMSSRGPRLAAAPAFTAWRGGAGGPAGQGDYTNYTSLTTQVSEAVTGQVAQWAKAYATGDSATLMTLTGDQNTSHRYLGLSGFTLPDTNQAVQTLSAIKVAGGMLIVRARILLARAGADGTVSGGNAAAGQYTTYADFDLLIGAPDGARPLVLAWGPAGSAAQLQPYSNAVGQ